MTKEVEEKFQDLAISLENLSYQIEYQMKMYDSLCINGLNNIGIHLEDKKEGELYPFFLHQMKLCEYFKSDIKKSLDLAFLLDRLVVGKKA